MPGGGHSRLPALCRNGMPRFKKPPRASARALPVLSRASSPDLVPAGTRYVRLRLPEGEKVPAPSAFCTKKNAFPLIFQKKNGYSAAKKYALRLKKAGNFLPAARKKYSHVSLD